MDFLKEAEDIKDDLIKIRREFHKYPELDYNLYKTSEKIKKFLKENNIEYKEYAGTGIAALICGEHKEKKNTVIALRTDMDALPVKEETGAEYTSKHQGTMHACGHDAHMTMVMGAVMLLNNHRDMLKGDVKVIFEPAEETTGGSKVMIEEGVLHNPEVTAILGCHVDESMEAGYVGVKRGVAYAASNPFSITLYGKGTHGASPHKGIDPIVMAAQVINSLQLLVSRETSPVNPAVITIGTINGGTAANVIPDKVTLSGIIRVMDMDDRARLIRRLKEVVIHEAEGLQGRAEIQIDESYPCLHNDDGIYEDFCDYTEELLGKEKVIRMKEPTLGVESFSYFAQKVPGLFYHVGCGNKEENITAPLHSCRFNIDENCLSVGAAVHANMIAEYLNKI